MAKYFSDIKKNFEFVIKLIEKISDKRENALMNERCDSLRRQIHLLNSDEEVRNFRLDLINLIDELKYIIHAEIRFPLYPLFDIKQEAYDLGKKYMNNFLEWLKPDEDSSVEEVIKLLNDEMYLIDEAKKILEKINLGDEQE